MCSSDLGVSFLIGGVAFEILLIFALMSTHSIVAWFVIRFIGGGIFGCSIAWNLARRKSGSVLLLERRELATATTPRAAGLIRNLNLKKGQTPLKTLTIEVISLLGDELEETLQWHQVGGLLVAESEANMMHLETLEKHAIEHRQKFQWIERTDAEIGRASCRERV